MKYITLAILLLALPATAHAGSGSKDIDGALGAAQAYWGKPAPCGSVWVRVLPTVVADNDAEAFKDRCEIHIRPSWWRNYRNLWKFDRTDRVFVRRQLCKLMIHEYGHLIGYGHTEPGDPFYDPKAPPIMSHAGWDLLPTPTVCRLWAGSREAPR